MDKEIIRQLSDLYKEYASEEKRVHDLECRIEAMQPKNHEVTDIVTKGRRGKKPLGICKIHGNADHTNSNRLRAKLRERKGIKEIHLSKIETMIIDAEEYIYSLRDSELRSILMYYCIDRMSWEDVARAMGSGYTSEACKQKFSRFMREK